MVNVKEKHSLLGHNTFRIDSTCRQWIEYSSPDELYALVDKIEGLDFFHIGAGSNIILPPHLDATVLHSADKSIKIHTTSGNTVIVRAGAGALLDDIALICCRMGIWGMENLSLIPGEAGSSVIQNVGAYGVEIGNLVEKVECFDTERHSFITLSRKECAFAYRDSIFKHNKNKFIVTSVTYRFDSESGPNLSYGNLSYTLGNKKDLSPEDVRNEIISVREAKLPSINSIGSAGSFFKNPVIPKSELSRIENVAREFCTGDTPLTWFSLDNGFIKIPAAWFIEKCGFKGVSLGNVGVWEKQPLVLINLTGHATSYDVRKAADTINDSIEATFGIRLETEVEFIENPSYSDT